MIIFICIVIVGGGIVGLQFVICLGECFGCFGWVQIMVVDCSLMYIWKLMLYMIVVGMCDVQQQQVIFFVYVCDYGYMYQFGELKGFDCVCCCVQFGEICLQDGGVVIDVCEFEYDVLIFVFGSQVNDFGVFGVCEYCYFIDSQQQVEIFNEVLWMCVFCSIVCDELFCVVIVGVGVMGVEFVVELSCLLEVVQVYGDDMVCE